MLLFQLLKLDRLDLTWWLVGNGGGCPHTYIYLYILHCVATEHTTILYSQQPNYNDVILYISHLGDVPQNDTQETQHVIIERREVGVKLASRWPVVAGFRYREWGNNYILFRIFCNVCTRFIRYDYGCHVWHRAKRLVLTKKIFSQIVSSSMFTLRYSLLFLLSNQ